MISGYRAVQPFAYPGWRLTVPGGPAGGHYKGFTHTEATGTTILPQDDYELDRGDGMSSHDMVHASRRNPRGVYRSSAEVPPRPNASGSAHVYRGLQTRHDPGDSVAPGSFPADVHQTREDDFLSLAENTPHYLNPAEAASLLGDVGYVPQFQDPYYLSPGRSLQLGPAYQWPTPVPVLASPAVPAPYHAAPGVPAPPNTVAAPASDMVREGLFPYDPPVALPGATSVVNQPAATPLPLPPAPAIPVFTAPPVSPAPAPVVNTNQMIPVNDGSGNYLNVSTGQIVPASAVTQNLATMQFTAAGAMSWLEQPSSIFPSIPNWGLLAGAALAASLLFGSKRR